jgi:hypothetical protein
MKRFFFFIFFIICNLIRKLVVSGHVELHDLVISTVCSLATIGILILINPRTFIK